MTEQEFINKDYELKIAYMKDHLTRMWNRFNYMLGFQLAIAGGKFFMTPATGSKSLEFGIMGLLFATLWYILGAQDRYLFDLYRKQVERSFSNIKIDGLPKDQSYVGKVNNAIENGSVKIAWHTWRYEPISSTKMAAIVPAVVGVLWLIYVLSIK